MLHGNPIPTVFTDMLASRTNGHRSAERLDLVEHAAKLVFRALVLRNFLLEFEPGEPERKGQHDERQDR